MTARRASSRDAPRTPAHPRRTPRTSPSGARDAAMWDVGRSRLRRDDVAHPFHGVAGVDLDLDTRQRRAARAFEPLLLDGQAFSHVTALVAARRPAAGVAGRRSPCICRCMFPRTPPRGIGVHGHSLRRLGRHDPCGLSRSPRPRIAWCQSASLLSREDLVAAGDALVTGPRIRGMRDTRGDDDRADGRGRHDSPGSPGSAKVGVGASARPLAASIRARSRGSGCSSSPRRLPEPAVDHEIEVAGGILLHADLADIEARIVFDYEGDVHRVDRVDVAARPSAPRAVRGRGMAGRPRHIPRPLRRARRVPRARAPPARPTPPLIPER